MLAKCEATGTRPVVQERLDTDLTENIIVHQPLDRYIINTHAFHNAHLLREIIPRHLITPLPLYEDREKTHHELAARLRTSEEVRAKTMAEKAAAKAADKLDAATKEAAEKTAADVNKEGEAGGSVQKKKKRRID